MYSALNDMNITEDNEFMRFDKDNSLDKQNTDLEWIGSIWMMKPERIAQYLRNVSLDVILREMCIRRFPFKYYYALYRAAGL